MTASTHAQYLAIHRNTSAGAHYKHGLVPAHARGISLEDSTMNAGVMPEIAESVISREEEEDEWGLRDMEARKHHDSVK